MNFTTSGTSIGTARLSSYSLTLITSNIVADNSGKIVIFSGSTVTGGVSKPGKVPVRLKLSTVRSPSKSAGHEVAPSLSVASSGPLYDTSAVTTTTSGLVIIASRHTTVKNTDHDGDPILGAATIIISPSLPITITRSHTRKSSGSTRV